MTAGIGFRMVGQAIVFFVVARVLGVKGYGAYSAVLALAMTLGSFTGLGTSTIMLRDTSRNTAMFAVSWGRTLGALLTTAAPLLAIYFLLAWAILPDQIARVVIICIGVAEILFGPMTSAALQAYQGHERMARAAWIVLVQVLPRLGAALTFGFALQLPQSVRLPVWAVAYLISSSASTGYALLLLRRDLGVGLGVCWRGLGHAIYDGWPFAAGGAALKVYVDIDKLMLSRLASLEAAGAYSAAYRVVDMACVPLMGFFSAAAPRFFRAGHDGIGSVARFTVSVLPLPMLYALAIGFAFYSLADLMPWLLGSTFASAIGALRWLAWLPLFSLPRLLMQTAFGASGRQRTGLFVLACGAVFNVVLNLWMIPFWGWWGAVLATYAAEFSMSAFLFASMIRDVRTRR